MKRFLGLAGALLLGFSLVLHAEAPDELFVQYYNMIQEADSMAAKGQERPALDRYREAEVGLKKLQLGFPSWNPNVVTFRLKYVDKKITPLAAKFPEAQTSAPVAAAKSNDYSNLPPEQRAVKTELDRMQHLVIDLRTEKMLLERKLKEALAAKPAEVDPAEMAKAQAKLTDLQKELDLAKVGLEQEQKKTARLVEPAMAEQFKKQLEDAHHQLGQQSATVATLTKDNESLQKKFETASKSKETAELKNENGVLKKQVSELEKKSATVAKLEETTGKLKKENDSLHGELDKAREEAKAAESKASKAAAGSAKVEELDRQLKTTQASLKEQQTAVDSLRKENKKMEALLIDPNFQPAAASAKADKLTKELAAAKEAQAASEASLAAVRKEKSALETKSSTKSNPRDVAKLKELEDAQAALEKKLKEANRNLEQQTAAANKADKLAKELAAAKEAQAASEASLAAVRKEKSALEAKSSTKSNPGDVAKLKELEAAQVVLEKKLKEANRNLEQQTAAASKADKLAKELAAAKEAQAASEASLAALRKEKGTAEVKSPAKSNPRDAAKLKELEAAQASLKNDQATIESLQHENKKLEKLLEDPNFNPNKVAALEAEKRKLQEQLKAATAADPKKAAELAAELKALEIQNAELDKKLKAAAKELADRKAQKEAASAAKLAEDVAALRARLNALDAQKVPYTKEELALFSAPAVPAVVKAPEVKATAPSSQELPPAARTLVLEAQRAFSAHQFDQAEKKYQEVLKLSDNNVFTLANLAAIQLEENNLNAAEGNLKKALAVDPKDAYSLSLNGILKFRQAKYDEALDALSLSAQLDPSNADTQNYLGITLSQKGQRVAAETALRKAIQLAPNNAGAHYNLAVVYATQKPPASELARWHYQKALSAGQAKNPEFEKMLNGK